MSRIRIKNFGPIKEGLLGNDGWVDVGRVTVFIGNQGSGKSTLAKLISTFTWMEKALVRGDHDKKWFERQGINRFKSTFLPYHRLESYTYPNDYYPDMYSIIEYEGDAYAITYKKERLEIRKKSNNIYPLPQIMYVPAERNFLTYVKGAEETRQLSWSLQEFNTEYGKALENMKEAIELPINTDVVAEYDKLNKTLNLKGVDYKVKITDASSGFQSFVPMYLVSKYLANAVQGFGKSTKPEMNSMEQIRFQKTIKEILNNYSLTDEQKRLAISELSSIFNKTAFINIIEEPEQNLFPISQWKMLQSLLGFNNMKEINKLILTTHSPYIINYLTLLVKAGELKTQIPSSLKRLKQELNNIVSLDSTIGAKDLFVYELDELTGTIKSLEMFNGLPSDENMLNEQMDEGNEMFAQLLEIQKQII